MKQLKGISINISHPILGKIVLEKRKFFQKKNNCIGVNINSKSSTYSAIVTDKKVDSTKFRVIHSVSGIENLKNGDIVEIFSDGTINVVYEKESLFNALFVTERCNEKCIMCPQPPNNSIPDNIEKIFKILSLLDKNVRHLGITGGEPTLLNDDLFKIIKIHNKKFSNSSLTLLTNGMKFSVYDYAVKLAEINHKDLQIDIPLYSDTDSEHNSIIGVKGFYKTIQGIYNLGKLNQKIGIRIVINKLNYKRLFNLAEFIYRNFPFVNHIAFMQMEPYGLAKENINLLWIDPFDYNIELKKAINFLFERELSVSIYNSQLCILPEKLRKFAKKSISTWKNIYLPECKSCIIKEDCPGLFESGKEFHSNKIRPINV